MYYDTNRVCRCESELTDDGHSVRLGPGDHKPVEDFLSRDHAGTTAITLDTNANFVTSTTLPQPQSTQPDVYCEPAAERSPRTRPDKFPFRNGQPYDTDALTRDAYGTAELAGRTRDKHLSITHVTAPTPLPQQRAHCTPHHRP